MVFVKLFSVVSASLFMTSAVAQLTVSCYSGGYTSDCARFINQFCNHATNNSYAPNDSMSRCFNDGKGGKCDLTVWLKNPGSANQSPSNTNCKNALNTAMQSCPYGGIGQYDGAPFQFAVDPNAGQCNGSVGGGSRLEASAIEDGSAAA
ncbi:hypothetical protein NMY22_g6808 [Coprinellus aureogranulatus]|nr:hypothetical protein NMY22_g6808 [Coprinellus aureogranulatus]